MNTSIVIPTYNHADNLRLTLAALDKHLPQSGTVEIVVVDNGSTGAAASVVDEMARRFRIEMKSIRESRPGLHRARHAGARAASGELLIYLDDDVTISGSWLAAYQAAFEDPTLAAAGGRVLAKWPTAQPMPAAQIPADYLSVLNYGDARLLIGRGQGINGCNYAIRKSVLFEMGGFHPDAFPDAGMVWFRGDGEAGLTGKLLANGLKVAYLPRAVVWHRLSEARLRSDRLERRAFAHGVETGYVFARRHQCARGPIISLYAGGLALGLLYSLGATWPEWLGGRRLANRLAAVRFRAVRQYAARLWADANLREHVVRPDYLGD